MEKSIRYMDSTASHIVNTSFCKTRKLRGVEAEQAGPRTESLSQPVNTDATGLVNPSKSIANAQTREPSNMYGLRRPNRDVELSASTPKSPSTKLVQTRVFCGERTNQRLHYQPRQRPGDEHSSHVRLGQSQREQIRRSYPKKTSVHTRCAMNEPRKRNTP